MANSAEGFDFINLTPANSEVDSGKAEDHQGIGGEVVAPPEMGWEELRFHIAARVGVLPETITMPRHDGVPIDVSEAYGAGKTSIAIAAQRFHFPVASTDGETRGPLLH